MLESKVVVATQKYILQYSRGFQRFSEKNALILNNSVFRENFKD